MGAGSWSGTTDIMSKLGIKGTPRAAEQEAEEHRRAYERQVSSLLGSPPRLNDAS